MFHFIFYSTVFCSLHAHLLTSFLCVVLYGCYDVCYFTREKFAMSFKRCRIMTTRIYFYFSPKFPYAYYKSIYYVRYVSVYMWVSIFRSWIYFVVVVLRWSTHIYVIYRFSRERNHHRLAKRIFMGYWPWLLVTERYTLENLTWQLVMATVEIIDMTYMELNNDTNEWKVKFKKRMEKVSEIESERERE